MSEPPPPLLAADSVAPVRVRQPDRQTVPVICTSPHSGCLYSPEFLAQVAPPLQELRRAEDMYVNDLFARVPEIGIPLLEATFPRSFLDVNREPYELDPAMFEGRLPRHANPTSPRVIAGLGTIPRLSGTGAPLYRQKLPHSEIDRRVEGFYRPYHQALTRLIAQTQERFGLCFVLDCHSMPSGLLPHRSKTRIVPGADFVLGDHFGASCDRRFPLQAEFFLKQLGYKVTRNSPYAGGFTTQHYGRPDRNVHVLQLEINRLLYMDESSYQQRPLFERLSSQLIALAGSLAQTAALQPLAATIP